jgi:hypothetical protein
MASHTQVQWLIASHHKSLRPHTCHTEHEQNQSYKRFFRPVEATKEVVTTLPHAPCILTLAHPVGVRHV